MMREPVPKIKAPVEDPLAALPVLRLYEDLREAFEVLQSEWEGIRRLLPHLRQGVLTVDRNLRIGLSNRAACELMAVTNLDEGDLLPDPWPGFPLRQFVSDLFLPEAPVSRWTVPRGLEGRCEVVGIPPRPTLGSAILVVTGPPSPGGQGWPDLRALVLGDLHDPICSIAADITILLAGDSEVSDRHASVLGRLQKELSRLESALHALVTSPDRPGGRAPSAVQPPQQPRLFGLGPSRDGALPEDQLRGLAEGRVEEPEAGEGDLRVVGGVTLDRRGHRVVVDSRQVNLTPAEFKLLSLLAGAPDRVFTRREILHHIWDTDYVSDERACDAHVYTLRHKIERDPARPERILTVRGFGYKLVPA